MAVLAASIVNIIGDLILSPIWGIQGAAVATAMATTTSCMILVNKVRKTTAEWKKKQEIQERLGWFWRPRVRTGRRTDAAKTSDRQTDSTMSFNPNAEKTKTSSTISYY